MRRTFTLAAILATGSLVAACGGTPEGIESQEKKAVFEAYGLLESAKKTSGGVRWCIDEAHGRDAYMYRGCDPNAATHLWKFVPVAIDGTASNVYKIVSKRTGRCLYRYPDLGAAPTLKTTECAVAHRGLYWRIKGLHRYSEFMTIGNYVSSQGEDDHYRIDWGYPNRVQTYIKHGGINQKWRNPFYNQTIQPSKNLSSAGKCLDLAGSYDTPFLNASCNSAHKWTIEVASHGAYKIATRNDNNDKVCLAYNTDSVGPWGLMMGDCVHNGNTDWRIFFDYQLNTFLLKTWTNQLVLGKAPRGSSSHDDLMLVNPNDTQRFAYFNR